MSQKLGRNYSLIVNVSNQGISSTVTIGLPFTLEFDITRNTLTSSNVCSIRVIGISPSNRNALRRSVTSGWSAPLIDVELRAGYGTNLPVIFAGNVSESWSVRDGTTFATHLECYDAGYSYVNAETNLTIPAGTPYKTVIKNLIQSLAPQITLGAVGNYVGQTSKPITLLGNTIDILNQFTGGGFFIDKGVGNALRNSEYTISENPPVINAATGLLGTPLFENNIVRFQMIFEPKLNVGTGVNLQSVTDANFNGLYKITSIKHRGTISATVCGDAVTEAEFFFLQQPVAVQPNGN